MITCPACDKQVPVEAEQCQECGITLRPYRLLIGLPSGYFNAGLAKAQEGALNEAIECFAVAAALNHDDVEAELVLGKLYAQRSNMRLARSHFERALAIQQRLRAPEDAIKATRESLAAVEQVSTRKRARRHSVKRKRKRK